MSNFNCRIGEAINFPRYESRHESKRRVFKKDKCCGFVGATVVADAVIQGRGETGIEVPAGQPVPFMTNTSFGFATPSTGTFTTQSCGTYSVTLKARVEAPGASSNIPSFTFEILVTGCGEDRTIGSLVTPSRDVNAPAATPVSVNRKVCLREGETIRVVPVQNVDLNNPNQAITLFFSAAKLSDCCNANGDLGFCRDCSCDKCDFDDHHSGFVGHHSGFVGHHSGFVGHHNCKCW